MTPYIETPGVEQWRPVVGYDGIYEISDYGRVKSLERIVINSRNQHRTLKAKMMKVAPHKGQSGYIVVGMSKGDGTPRRLITIHRIVAIAFHPNPNNHKVVCHIDDNPQNPHARNLRWGTYTENTQQSVLSGRHKCVDMITATHIRSLLITYRDQCCISKGLLKLPAGAINSIAAQYNVSYNSIVNIRSNTTQFDQNWISKELRWDNHKPE